MPLLRYGYWEAGLGVQEDGIASGTSHASEERWETLSQKKNLKPKLHVHPGFRVYRVLGFLGNMGFIASIGFLGVLGFLGLGFRAVESGSLKKQF